MPDTGALSLSFVVAGQTYTANNVPFTLSSSTPSPTPTGTGIFTDDFSGTTLKTNWKVLNGNTSIAKPWILGTVGGEPALIHQSENGHGFYKSVETGENENSPISVLYIDAIDGQPIYCGDGLDITCKVGFSPDTPLGQITFFVAPLTPNDPRTESTSAVTQVRTYWKVPFEFDISANKVVVLLRELDNQANVSGNMALSAPVAGNPAQCEIRGRIVGSNIVAEFRPVGSTTWLSVGSQPLHFPANVPCMIGLFVEEDHFIANPSTAKNGWFKLFYAKNGVSSSPTPTPAPTGTPLFKADFIGASGVTLAAYTPEVVPTTGSWSLTGSAMTLNGSGKLVKTLSGPDEIRLNIPLSNFRCKIKANVGTRRFAEFKTSNGEAVAINVDTTNLGGNYKHEYSWGPGLINTVTNPPAISGSAGMHEWEYVFNGTNLKVYYDGVLRLDATNSLLSQIPAGYVKFEWDGSIEIDSIEVSNA
jgi:hypothetical protein